MDTTAIAIAVAAVGLPNLAIIYDPDDVAALERKPECQVSFATAIQLALEAFLTDGRGSPVAGNDSALAIVRNGPEDFGLSADPSDSEITEVLRRMLHDDPQARMVLLTPTTMGEASYRFPPEYGENTEEHWVFRIIAPQSWPFLQWSIVDLRGETSAYSYLFD